jgi:hypothetical protein
LVDVNSSSLLSPPQYTVAFLHKASSLFRVSFSLILTSHPQPLPLQSLAPSPLFDVVFVALSTTPSSLSLAPPLPNTFPSIIPPFLPTLHMDAIDFCAGTNDARPPRTQHQQHAPSIASPHLCCIIHSIIAM